MSFSVEQIEGAMPALVTPYESNGNVNVEMIRRLVEFQMDQGCHGFFVCGSTGEGLLLTADERKLVARTVIETVAGHVPVIVHVGAASTREAAGLAADARAAGADAVSSIPPIYYKVGLEGMMRHISAIARAADLPTYYYHIPALTGVDLGPQELVDAFTGVDGLAGLKYTDTNMFFLWWITRGSQSGLRVFNGPDQMLFDGLCNGACGGIGSTYNYQAATMAGIFEAVKAGDLDKARTLQEKANRNIKVLFAAGSGVPCEKAILTLAGFDVGPPRSPMVPFPEARMAELRRQLELAGFFD